MHVCVCADLGKPRLVLQRSLAALVAVAAAATGMHKFFVLSVDADLVLARASLEERSSLLMPFVSCFVWLWSRPYLMPANVSVFCAIVVAPLPGPMHLQAPGWDPRLSCSIDALAGL